MTNKIIIKDILNGIKKISGNKKVFLHEPYFFNEDFKSIEKCLKTTQVSSHSQYVKKFEKKLCSYTRAKYSVATINGTSALHLSLLAIGVKSNDEIVIPNYNYIAPANAVLYCNAKPIFIDVELETYGLDPFKFKEFLEQSCFTKNKKTFNKKTKKQIKAVVVTHVYGNPCRIEPIINIAKKYNLKIIEDASEALGSFYKSKHLGTFGDIGVLSFNGNKIITTGGGGAAITNDKKLFDKFMLIATIAKTKNSFWDYKELGYNFRMPGLNAALGISQLNNISFIKKKKKELFNAYYKEFLNNENFKIVEPISENSNNWLVSLWLKKSSHNLIDSIVKTCIKNNFNVRPGWKIMTKIPHFKKYKFNKESNSIIVEKSLICLPSSWHIMNKK